MPMVKSCMEIRQPGGKDYSWGLIVPASFAQKYKIPTNGAVRQLPAKKTLFCDFRAEIYSSTDSKTLPRDYPAQKRLKQLGLKAAGSLYKILLMYNHINSNTMQENGYFMAPLE